jgi:serine/threonine protein phosphatase PrpC
VSGAPPTCYLAVFDGHEGALAAQYAATHLLPNTLASSHYVSSPRYAIVDGFRTTDEAFNRHAAERAFRDGTTAVVVLLRDDCLMCAWVGDSEALLYRCVRGEERVRVC